MGKGSVHQFLWLKAFSLVHFSPHLLENHSLLKIIMASASVTASGSPVNMLINYPPCEQISSQKPPVCVFSLPHSAPSNLSTLLPLINWPVSWISPQYLIQLCIVLTLVSCDGSDGHPHPTLASQEPSEQSKAVALLCLLDLYLSIWPSLCVCSLNGHSKWIINNNRFNFFVGLLLGHTRQPSGVTPDSV